MGNFLAKEGGVRFRLALVWLVVLLASLTLGAIANGPAPVKAAESIFFKETNLALSNEHRFLSYWQANGGLAQFGYPITPEIMEVNPADQKTYIVQWFERNRFEWHPEFKGTQYEVLLGLLGRQLTIGREGETPFKSVGDPRLPTTTTYFAPTGHTMANSFKTYWESHGGLALFGYPITEEFPEMSSNGKLYTTQWFERAKFEYHPEFKGTPYDVLLGLLGNQIVGGFAYPDPSPNNVPAKIVVPDRYRTLPFQQDRLINLPPGFKISVFVAGLTDPRLMALAPTGDIFVTERFNGGGGSGKVKIIRDLNNDGIADETRIYVENIGPYPHGIAFYGSYLYVAMETKVVRYPYQAGDLTPRGPAQTIIGNLPSGQTGVATGHNTRTIVFGPDGKLYVSIGSSCDNCIETDPLRASIWQYNPDGTGGRAYATGLRNAVAIGFDPKTNLLWAAVNGRNGLGKTYPPEQLTPLRDGGNYGWPYCAGTNPPKPDPDFGAGKDDFCANKVDRALLSLQAHVAPLGLTFYNANMFPEVYRGGLFVVQHGSATSETSPIFGDGIRFVSTRPGKLQKGVTDFATGWINSQKTEYWGRTVFPLVGTDGALYVSDDIAGAIYRISYGS